MTVISNFVISCGNYVYCGIYIKTVCAKSGYHLCFISVGVGKSSVNI